MRRNGPGLLPRYAETARPSAGIVAFAAFPVGSDKKDKETGKDLEKNHRTNSPKALDFPRKFDIIDFVFSKNVEGKSV